MKNLLDNEAECGLIGWWKLNNGVQGFSGYRTQGLSNTIYTPTRLKHIKDVDAGLEEWDNNLKLYQGSSEDKVSNDSM